MVKEVVKLLIWNHQNPGPYVKIHQKEEGKHEKQRGKKTNTPVQKGHSTSDDDCDDGRAGCIRFFYSVPGGTRGGIEG